MNPLLEALRNRAADDVVVGSAGHGLQVGVLLEQVALLAEELRNRGINRLGLLAANSEAWVVADLACLTAGICLLPLPRFFSDEQLRHAVSEVGINAILTDDPDRTIGIAAAQSGPDEAADMLMGLTFVRLQPESRPALPAGTQKITFTSGSTGAPRGVCLSVANQLQVAEALCRVLPVETPRHLCLLPLSTLLENIGGLYYPLIAGGSIVIPAEAESGLSGSSALDIPTMLRSITRHRPTSIILLPQMLVGLVAAAENGWQAPDTLRFVAVGGAKVAPELISRAHAAELPVYEGYGLSEAGSVVCLNLPDAARIGSVGKPLSHVNVCIEDGEVCIRGNTFLGYAGQPGSWGTSKLRTGDLGSVDVDGYLHLRGRSRNLMISDMGRNISPEWVESELLTHPEIAQCVVFGDARPYCSALIAGAGQDVSDRRIQSLLDEINRKLPDYARVLRWHRLPGRLTAADGLYTENGRPNRPHIARHFAHAIESLYNEATLL